MNVDALNELAKAVAETKRQVEVARNAVEIDKQKRASSLWARLADAFTTTNAEGELVRAENHHEDALARGKQAARQWIITTASQSLTESKEDAERHKAQIQALARAQARFERVHNLLVLAQDAGRQLAAARYACSAASSMELMDFASTNKCISALSHTETSGAAYKVKSANKAVRALAEELPKQTAQVDIDLPNDLLDFFLDMTIDPGFDLLSLVNMGKLNNAERQCAKMADKLKPLLEQLGDLDFDIQKKVDDERVALRQIERPYLEAATAQVPRDLGMSVPLQLPNS